MDLVTKQKALQNWVVACTGIAADHVIWGQQQGPRPTQAGIVMRLMLQNDEGMPWIDVEANPFVITTLTVTAVSTINDTITVTGHGLSTGDGPFTLASTGTLPGGAVASIWVIKVDNNTLRIANSFLNSKNNIFLDLTSAGTGTITINSNTNTLKAGQEVLLTQRSLVKVMLTLECYTDIGTGLDMASAILWRVAEKRLLPTPVTILRDANIGVSEVTRVRAYGGTQGQYLFEPRASMDISLYLVSEASEAGSIFERSEITNDTTSNMWTVDPST